MKNLKLGIPYMGSKRGIAKGIVDYILQNNPKTKYVFDLFGGGGAISFELLQRKQIQQVHYNELNTGVVELLKKIKDDGVTDEFYKWVSREEFEAHKDDNDWYGGLLKTCWSFGNNQRDYLFGKDGEEYKRQGHLYSFGGDIEGIPECSLKDVHPRRKFLNRFAKNEFKNKIKGIEEKYKEYLSIKQNKYSHEEALRFTRWLKSTGITAKEVSYLTNSQMSSHFLAEKSQPAVPTTEMWEKLKTSPKLATIPREIDFFDDDYKKKRLLQIAQLQRQQLLQLEQLEQLEQLQRLEQLEQLEQLQRLEQLERLERLERLQRLERLEILNQSYLDVEINTPVDETIIYLDPPYFNTTKYQEDICHKELMEYIKNSPYKIYVSSYDFDLPEVWSVNKRCTLSATSNNNKVVEKLFCNQPEANNISLL